MKNFKKMFASLSIPLLTLIGLSFNKTDVTSPLKNEKPLTIAYPDQPDPKEDDWFDWFETTLIFSEFQPSADFTFSAGDEQLLLFYKQ
ncbi:hypothetical protein SAMN05216436_105239 [bacterium A37T11]|nr:hypothetical protein SAMN05216436_105239 [bacterium A37T11]